MRSTTIKTSTKVRDCKLLDISKAAEPRSDQQNYDDYIAGPRVVTIAAVKSGSSEQPVELHLVEHPGKPYKPGKSMVRVLMAAWGKDASQFVGRRMRLYGDPTIKFGKAEVGGIRISHLSHLPGPQRINLTVTRGKREPFQVLPLEEPAPIEPPEGWVDDVAACESVGDIQEFYEMAHAAGWWSPAVAAACTARKVELSDG